MVDSHEYLKLAVIEQMKFDDIAKKLCIDRSKVSKLWEELKEEREELSELRRIWKKKFKEEQVDFWEFKEVYISLGNKCHYCEITQEELDQLWINNKVYTKRTRGRKLELERIKPNEEYNNTINLTLACYWCNNAKTDTFTEDEFMDVGSVIKRIWAKRLQNLND